MCLRKSEIMKCVFFVFKDISVPLYTLAFCVLHLKIHSKVKNRTV